MHAHNYSLARARLLTISHARTRLLTCTRTLTHNLTCTVKLSPIKHFNRWRALCSRDKVECQFSQIHLIFSILFFVFFVFSLKTFFFLKNLNKKRFTRPKLLPCQHSFCENPCLEGLINYAKRKITCPECRAEHWVSQGNQSHLL